ncbi:MAG: penicillin acylase family protein [Solirubrobacterales bacterium]
MKFVRLAVLVLVGAAVALGPSVASADASNHYAKQAKKKCKKKTGAAKQKCVKKTIRALKAKDNPPVTIRTTEYGIPRIVADSDRGIGFGYGYSLAKENICTLAENYLSLRGEKSKYFGPDNGNLNSDFVRKQFIQQGKVKQLLNGKGINAVKSGAREVVKGYVLGYNKYLKDVGRAKIPDPTCRGAAWVRPITEQDVYLRFIELLGYAGTGNALNAVAEAAPPGAPVRAKDLGSDFEPELDIFNTDEGSLGSNAVALGSEATDTSRGMLFGNPHFPWSGPLRLFQSQLTIPGKLNVSGGSLFGVPMVMIGHTQKAAWSHTVSTARRFVLFRLDLAAGKPTTYLQDGREIKMTARKITVQSKQPDGSLVDVTRTLYSTKQGPVVESFPGVPSSVLNLEWTDRYAYVLRDPNLDSFRVLNHFYDVNRAQSVSQIEKILDKYQAIPWVNTIAADSEGNAFYGDIGMIPNVPNSKVEGSCGVSIALWAAGRVPVLNGSDSDCLLDKAPGAAAEGILPRDANPRITRQDYATNMNDSAWLANPAQPLTGYPRIIGDENLPRSLRTRNGLVQIAQKLSGGGRFGISDVQNQLTNGKNYGAQLLKGGIFTVCNSAPGGALTATDGTSVTVSGACPALAAYGSTDTLDDPGALLWRRIAVKLPLSDSTGLYAGSLYQSPFLTSDPVNTPNGLNASNSRVPTAIADAVKEFQSAGVPFDATLRDHQYVTRNGVRIPIPGGPGGLGVYNAINVNSSVFNSSSLDYYDVPSGSSFVMAASLDGNKCPDVRTILTYSQAATNSTSPYYDDQTRLFSEGGWLTDRFCKSQQLADPTVKTKKLNGGSKTDSKDWYFPTRSGR